VSEWQERPLSDLVTAAPDKLDHRADHRSTPVRERNRLLGIVFGVRQVLHGDLVEALYATAEPAGYDVALSAVVPGRDERRAVQALLDQGCEALVLLSPDLRPKVLAELAETMPVVVVARKVQADGVDVIRNDDSDGLRQAVEHLVAKGHRHIVHVDGGRAPGAAERRIGYKTAMRRAGLNANIWVVAGGQTEDAGSAAAQRILREAPNTTAVTVFNDRSALGLIDSVRREGREVPGDLSIVGYDDSAMARLAHVGLTTIGVKPRRLAELAVERVNARLDGKDGPYGELVVTPSLVTRRSTAPVRG